MRNRYLALAICALLPLSQGVGAQSVTTWGASAIPGGSNGQIQYNSSGTFAGAANITTDGSALKFSGTGGAGFINYGPQSAAPSTPSANNFRLYADASGNHCWVKADGFTRCFSSTITANRTFTWQDASYTVAGLDVTQTFSAGQTFSAALTLSGNLSGAFGTTGVRLIQAAFTQTDSTTGAGTVTAAYGSRFNAVTFATAANAITITDAFGSYFNDPVAGSNVTLTRKWAAGFDSLKVVNNAWFAGNIYLNSGSSVGAVLNGNFFQVFAPTGLQTPNLVAIGGTTSSYPAIGRSSASLTLVAADGTVPTYASCTGLTTNASGVLACTVSDKRLKHPEGSISNAVDLVMHIPAGQLFHYLDPKRFDENQHIGIYAQDVCRVLPQACVHQKHEGKPELNYDDRAVLSLALKAIQELNLKVANDNERLARLEKLVAGRR